MAQTQRRKDPCRIIIRGRGLYMHTLFQLEYPRDDSGNISTQDYKTCGCRILIPKNDSVSLNRIRLAIDEASKKKFGRVVVREGRPGYPLLDGDAALEEDIRGTKGAEFSNHFYINVKSFNKTPGLVDDVGSLVEDPSERDELCVSGWFYKFSLTFKGSDKSINQVRAELNNLMFVKEGERLDGGIAADAEEWDVEEEEEIPTRESRPLRQSRRARREE